MIRRQVLFLAALAGLLVPGPSHAQITTPSLIFEANAGQTDPQVKFLSRGPGYTLFLTPSEAVLALLKAPGDGTVVRMTLVGAHPSPAIAGLEKLPGIVNYFIGNDPAQWRTSIPTFARVKYQGVYPGVDLVYYGDGRQLEYDFVVAPGADPKAITLAFEGPDKLDVDAQGDLVLRTAGGELRLKKPLVYQEVDGQRRPIAGNYILKPKNRVGLQLATYDAAKPLIIDPALVYYSTYLGGSGTDQGRGIALGPAGTAYVVGSTSANFSTISPKLGPGGGSDVFVAKIDPAQPGAASLVYLTFIGGRSTDTGRSIDVDGAGNAYLTGQTFSSDFPTTPLAFSTKISGKADAFVLKLNPTGTVLVYSTFLGGGGPDEGHAIAVACASASEPTNCNAYVTGATLSSNFPITPFAAFASSQGKQDAFVTKLKVDGSGLVYSTYLGGTGDDAGHGIALWCSAPPSSITPPDCNAWVTGETGSNNFFTTVGAFDRVFNGNVDAFVTQLNAAGSALLYSSYLGGSGFDRGFGIALDNAGLAYVAGSTDSASFKGDLLTKTPTKLGVGGGGDAFVAKIDPSLVPNSSQLVYLTTIGGSASDIAYAIDVDAAGNAYLTGETSSGAFPTVNPLPLALSASTHAFVASLNASGSALIYSTYLGGNGIDRGFGILLNAAGRIFVTGESSSTNFPTSATFSMPTTSFDTIFSGGLTDAFVTVLDTAPDTKILSGPLSLTNNRSATFTFESTDLGSTFECSLDGAAFTPCSSPQSYSGLADGIHTFEVRATDAAGHTDPTPASYTWTVDGTQPVSTITFPTGPAHNNSGWNSGCGTAAGDICGTASDPVSGVQKVEVSVKQNGTTDKYWNGSAFASTGEVFFTATLSGTGTMLNWSFPFAASNFPAEGSYTVHARATDNAGNVEAGPTVIFDIDNTPPVFGAVSNLMFQMGTTVTYPTPPATDAHSLTVSCDPPSGSAFPLGDTTVTCTATDAAGNQSTISFIITVQTDAPPVLTAIVPNTTVPWGAPIILNASISVSQSTTTITPDCVNTTFTIKRPDGSTVEPRFRERMYGIPNDLTTIDVTAPFKLNCDISEVVDPSLLPPGQYKFFVTYSNYIQDKDPTPPVFTVWTGSVSSSPEAILTITDTRTIRVSVDVKPNGFPNSWNCANSSQAIPVAVLSGLVFDPTTNMRGPFDPSTIDVTSVRFGRTGAQTESYDFTPTITDVNGDGVPDLIFHFPFGLTTFNCNDIPAGQQDATVVGVLTGTTQGGAPISGSDSIRLVTGANVK